MSTTQLARTEDAWRNQIQSMEPQFRRALPEHVPAERFVRATETAIMRDPELLSCDRKSLFQAVMQCAETGLMPNGRDAALVRFKRQVQFIPMIGGILRLMRNTGEVQTLIAEIVCENDEFFYRLGDDPKIEHTPAMGDRGKVTCAYAVLKTKDGGVYREVMSRSEIDKVQRCSKAESGPWKSWYNEMARKTVLRRLAKKCPLSTDTLIDLASKDDEMYDLSAVEQPPSQIEQMRAKLQAIPADQIEGQLPEVEPEDESQDPSEPATIEEVGEAIKHELRPFKDEASALAAMEASLKDMPTAKDVDEYVQLWRGMLLESFAHDDIERIGKLGNSLVLKRKQALASKGGANASR
jgi:recombination protein RecT